jgi:hypothetical protein
LFIGQDQANTGDFRGENCEITATTTELYNKESVEYLLSNPCELQKLVVVNFDKAKDALEEILLVGHADNTGVISLDVEYVRDKISGGVKEYRGHHRTNQPTFYELPKALHKLLTRDPTTGDSMVWHIAMCDSSEEIIGGLRGNVLLPAFQDYVDNRDARLQTLMSKCGVLKTEAKDLYTQLLSGGTYKDWSEMYSPMKRVEGELDAFECEREEWLKILNQSKLSAFASGPVTKAITRVLNSITADILTEAKVFLEDRGYEVGALFKNSAFVKKIEADFDVMLDKLNHHMSAKYKFPLTFSIIDI